MTKRKIVIGKQMGQGNVSTKNFSKLFVTVFLRKINICSSIRVEISQNKGGWPHYPRRTPPNQS